MQMKGEATLAQLPWVDTEVLKRLGRKRIRSLSDLLGLSAKERRLLLTSAGGRSYHAASIRELLHA